MCLNDCYRLTNKERECYKIVEIVKYKGNNIFIRSPYSMQYQWELGKEQEPEKLSIPIYHQDWLRKITVGFFHSFCSYEDAIEQSKYLNNCTNCNIAIVKCTIPEDAITYKGIINDGFEYGYASTKLIAQKIIYLSKPKYFEGLKWIKDINEWELFLKEIKDSINEWELFKEIKAKFCLNSKNCRFNRKRKEICV